jgi:RimJ/RimL family protein N-acetyltransferase
MGDESFSSFFCTSAPRIVLDRLRAGDATSLSAYRSDAAVAQYQSWTSCPLIEAENLVADMRDCEPGEPGWFQFAVRDRAGVLLGDAALYTAFDRLGGKIGFTLASAMQGQGLGKEIVIALVTYAFRECGFQRIIAETDARNERSAAVLRHAGFTLEKQRCDVPFKGELITECVYGLLRADWR